MSHSEHFEAIIDDSVQPKSTDIGRSKCSSRPINSELQNSSAYEVLLQSQDICQQASGKCVQGLAGSGKSVVQDPAFLGNTSKPMTSAEDDDSLEDIRLPWVDDPDPSKFVNHRSFLRYSRELKTLTDVMRKYSKSDKVVESDLLDSTLAYSLKAHDVYHNALTQWLIDNRNAYSRSIVQKLFAEYKGREDLIRYHRRAKFDPELRSEVSAISRASNESNAHPDSHCSQNSASIIKGQQRQLEHWRKQSQLKDLLFEEKALESNLLALQLKRKELELSDLQQFVSDIESAADAAEMDEVYSLHKFSPTQQTSKPVLTSTAASLRSNTSILKNPAKEHTDSQKIRDKYSISCKENLLVKAPHLNQTASIIHDKPLRGQMTHLKEPRDSQHSTLNCSMPSSWLSSELPSLQQTGTANVNCYHTRGPDLVEKSAKINTANYSNLETLDYYPSHQHITGCIDENANTTKLSSVSTPAIQRCTDEKILYSNVLGRTCTGGMFNSFLNNRQNNDILFSSGYDAVQSTIASNNLIPLSIPTNVYPDVALPSFDVKPLSAINCNSSSANMKPPFSSVYIGPGVNTNKGGILGTSFSPIHCNSTNVCAEPVCYSAPLSSGCVQSSYGVSPSFSASRFCNASDPIKNATISAPPGFPQFPNTNWPSFVAPTPWLAGKRLIDESGIKFSGKIAAEYPAYRHRFIAQYNELRHARPDLLLRWLENTIEGQAKRFIQDAFAVVDPGKACDVIWETLEEVYGKKDMIIENAVQQIKRPTKSIEHDRKALLELIADLRNLKGVALSIGQDQALKDIHMLGKLYSAFSDKLRSRFDSQYPADKWAYDQFLEFLTSEITHVDSLHLMKVDSKGKDIQHKERNYGSYGRSRLQVPMRMVAAVQPPKNVLHPTSAGSKHCVLHPSSDTHTLSQCKRFLSMHERDRWLVIKDNKLCFVCFGEDHVSRSCKVESPCKNCNKRHHELLHLAGNDVKTRSSSHSVGMDSSPHPKPKANSSTTAVSFCF